MRYAGKEAQGAFSVSDENYDKPLALLEQSFKEAGLNIEFVCAIGTGKAKIVSIYRDGFLQRQQSIEGDSPAQAVKDVAAGVRL
jgi:hypothetical protein